METVLCVLNLDFFFPELLYFTRLLLSSYSEVSSQPENHTSDTWQYTVLQAAVIGRVSRLHVLSNDMFQFMFSSSRCSPIINQSKSSNTPSLKKPSQGLSRYEYCCSNRRGGCSFQHPCGGHSQLSLLRKEFNTLWSHQEQQARVLMQTLM